MGTESMADGLTGVALREGEGVDGDAEGHSRQVVVDLACVLRHIRLPE